MRYASILLLLPLAACVSGQAVSRKDMITINLANSTCEVKQVRKEIRTQLEVTQCKEEETLKKMDANSKSYSYLKDFFSKEKEIAAQFDEKKITKSQFIKLDRIYSDQTAALMHDNYQDLDQSAAAGRAMAGAMGAGMQQQSQFYQQRAVSAQQQAVQPLPKTSYNCSSQNYGAYDQVTCY